MEPVALPGINSTTETWGILAEIQEDLTRFSQSEQMPIFIM
jgi:hypothetical protein